MRSSAVPVLDSPPLPPERPLGTEQSRARKGARVVKLTDRNVRTLPAIDGRRTDYTDEFMPGFILRVSPTGHRSYCIVYGSGPNKARYTVAALHRMSLADARKKARAILRSFDDGHDPQAELVEERRAEANPAGGSAQTFSSLCDDFVEDQSPDWRPSTRASWTRYVDKELKPALGAMPPAEIRPADVRAFVDRIRKGVPASTPGEWTRRPAPVSAQRAYEVLRRVFAWAVWKERLPFSPCEQAKPFERGKRSARPGKSSRRAKAYSNEQLRAIFGAARGTELGLLMELIARTGARSHEARAARWEDFDEQRKVWSIPPEAQKMGEFTGEAHLVPLTPATLRSLKRIRAANQAAGHSEKDPWLFPAPTSGCEVCDKAGHTDKPNKASAAIKKAAGITDRGLLHRFRDTLKTRLSEHGVDARVSEHILGHVVPGIAGVYDHAEMLPQRRAALVWWGQELDRILRRRP
jgi:integrase